MAGSWFVVVPAPGGSAGVIGRERNRAARAAKMFSSGHQKRAPAKPAPGARPAAREKILAVPGRAQREPGCAPDRACETEQAGIHPGPRHREPDGNRNGQGATAGTAARPEPVPSGPEPAGVNARLRGGGVLPLASGGTTCPGQDAGLARAAGEDQPWKMTSAARRGGSGHRDHPVATHDALCGSAAHSPEHAECASLSARRVPDSGRQRLVRVIPPGPGPAGRLPSWMRLPEA